MNRVENFTSVCKFFSLSAICRIITFVKNEHGRLQVFFCSRSQMVVVAVYPFTYLRKSIEDNDIRVVQTKQVKKPCESFK